jgi:hypothetical protein
MAFLDRVWETVRGTFGLQDIENVAGIASEGTSSTETVIPTATTTTASSTALVAIAPEIAESPTIAVLCDPLPQGDCARALQELRSEVQLHEHSLPVAPTEPPIVVLTCADDRIGIIDAPSCPPASSCSCSCLQKRVKAGQAAAFVQAPPVDPISGDLHAAVLTTLTGLVQVSAELRQDELGVPAAQLPVAYELSITHGGVLISLPVSSTEGSRVVISRVSIAGCNVALGDATLEVIVGFNHAPAPEGLVYTAGEAGDVPALMRLLDGGASTEEKDMVSGCIRP